MKIVTIALIIFLYICFGYAFLLLSQIYYSNHKDSKSLIACTGNTNGDSFFISLCIIFWPGFLFGAFLIDFLPWLFKSGYKVFVTIIFLIVALFKK